MTHRFHAVAVAMLLALAVQPAFGAAGDLDPTFGNGGRVATAFGCADEALAGVAQPDGKFVAAGYTGIPQGLKLCHGVPVLARYNANGTLDPTFGSGGRVTLLADQPLSHTADALVLQPDGKLVAAVTVLGGAVVDPYDWVLVRYNADGTPDTGFGSGGVSASSGDDSQKTPEAVALQADGKLVVAGTRYGSPASFFLARYNADGSLDTDFGPGGTVATSLGHADFARALAIQSDQKIVVAGFSSTSRINLAVARYNSDGTLDPTFGSGGAATANFGTDSYGFALALHAGGVVAGGGVAGGIGLARFDTNGVLDPTFGSGGLVTTPGPGYARAIVVDAAGKLAVTAGASVLRYTATGALDPSFGSGGMVTTSFGSLGWGAAALALQPDAKLVAAGSWSTVWSQGIAVVRYLTVDADTDGDGVVDVDDNCPTTANTDQADADGDGRGDLCDACTNVGGAQTAAIPRLTFSKLNLSPGDDSLALSGRVALPAVPALDPLTNGVRILITDSVQTIVDHTILGTPYSRAAKFGWTANAAHTSFRYADRTGLGDIRKVSITPVRSLPGTYKILVSGKKGTYPAVPAGLPLTAAVILDHPNAQSGQCGEWLFPGPTPHCVATTRAGSIRCK